MVNANEFASVLKRLDAYSLAKPNHQVVPSGSILTSASHCFGGASKKLWELLDELEQYLSKQYGCDFAALGWHGRSSHQRIFWQDDDVIELLSDPALVQVLLTRAVDGYELDLGSGNTLSSLLLGGLIVNRPSYLLTAAPNWKSLPCRLRKGETWLDDMAVGADAVYEKPRIVTLAFLSKATNALASVFEILGDKVGVKNCTLGYQATCRYIDQANSALLLKALDRILDERRATLLVRGEAGASTALDRMSGQCLEIMANYDDLLELHAGRHDHVLGYGLVSHALDAKHLAAAVVHALALGHHTYRSVTDGKAARSLSSLLRATSDQALSSPANELMRARICQIFRLIADNQKQLDLSNKELHRAIVSG